MRSLTRLADATGACPLPQRRRYRKALTDGQDFCWQLDFSAVTPIVDPQTGQRVQWHLYDNNRASAAGRADCACCPAGQYARPGSGKVWR